MAKKKSSSGRQSTNLLVTAVSILLMNAILAGIMKSVNKITADADCQKTLSKILENLPAINDQTQDNSNVVILNAKGPANLDRPFDQLDIPKGVRVSVFYHRRSSLAGLPVQLSRIEVSHTSTKRIFRYLSVNSISLNQIIDESPQNS